MNDKITINIEIQGGSGDLLSPRLKGTIKSAVLTFPKTNSDDVEIFLNQKQMQELFDLLKQYLAVQVNIHTL